MNINYFVNHFNIYLASETVTSSAPENVKSVFNPLLNSTRMWMCTTDQLGVQMSLLLYKSSVGVEASCVVCILVHCFFVCVCVCGGGGGGGCGGREGGGCVIRFSFSAVKTLHPLFNHNNRFLVCPKTNKTLFTPLFKCLPNNSECISIFFCHMDSCCTFKGYN